MKIFVLTFTFQMSIKTCWSMFIGKTSLKVDVHQCLYDKTSMICVFLVVLDPPSHHLYLLFPIYCISMLAVHLVVMAHLLLMEMEGTWHYGVLYGFSCLSCSSLCTHFYGTLLFFIVPYLYLILFSLSCYRLCYKVSILSYFS